MQKGRIYKITNKITNQIYIGCTIYSLEKRFNEHLYRCYNSDHKSKLYNSIKKYGNENFMIDLIEECDLTIIYETEKKYIQKFDTYHNGLNNTLGGEGCLGYRHSSDIRKKISDTNKNIERRKGKTYDEIYGNLGEIEKSKRSNTVKHYWESISENEKKIRIDKLTKSLEDKSKFTLESKIDIKRKINEGVPLNQIIDQYPNISYSMLYAIKKGNRWKNIKC